MSIYLTICDPQDLWDYIQAPLSERLPIEELILHTNTGNRVTARQIHVELIRQNIFYPVESERKQMPMYWHNVSGLTILLLKCDNPDMYKKALKKEILKFATSFPSYAPNKKNQQQHNNNMNENNVSSLNLSRQLMIVFITFQSLNDQQKHIKNQMKLFDKISSDFGKHNTIHLQTNSIHTRSSRRSSNAQPILIDTKEQQFQWDILMEMFKHKLQLSFVRKSEAYERECDRLFSMSSMPLWNFFTFYLVKESFIFYLSAFKQYDEAMRLYDEISALMERTQINLLLQTIECDDNGIAPLLNDTPRIFRQRILQQSLREVDFRRYVFSRQVLLLLKLRRPHEVLLRCREFIDKLYNIGNNENMNTEIMIYVLGLSIDIITAAQECLLEKHLHVEANAPRFNEHELTYKAYNVFISEQKRLDSLKCDLLMFILGELQGFLEEYEYCQFSLLFNHSFSYKDNDDNDNDIKEEFPFHLNQNVYIFKNKTTTNRRSSFFHTDESSMYSELYLQRKQCIEDALNIDTKNTSKASTFFLAYASFVKDAAIKSHRLRMATHISILTGQVHLLRSEYQCAYDIFIQVYKFFRSTGWRELYVPFLPLLKVLQEKVHNVDLDYDLKDIDNDKDNDDKDDDEITAQIEQIKNNNNNDNINEILAFRYVITLISIDEYILRCYFKIDNNTNNPSIIVGDIRLETTYEIISSPLSISNNNKLILTTPEEEICFIYEIKKNNNNETKDNNQHNLYVKTTTKTTNNQNNHINEYHYNIKFPTNPEIQAYVTTPSTVLVNEFFTITVKVAGIVDKCLITVDEYEHKYLIRGKSKRLLNTLNEESITFELIPLSSGQHQVPRILFQRVSFTSFGAVFDDDDNNNDSIVNIIYDRLYIKVEEKNGPRLMNE